MNSVWLTTMFSYSWRRAIYTVNPSQASLDDPDVLTTPRNKGHESIAYLTYIVDNYSSLPSVIAFLHSHRSGFLRAWHVDAPLHDNVAAMRSLQLGYIRRTGYVNLRCNWNPGCTRLHLKNSHITKAVWDDVFNNTSTSPIAADTVPANNNSNSNNNHHHHSSGGTRDTRSTQHVFSFPSQVAVPCCAQFAVSREQVHKRPLHDYIKFRDFIITTPRDDATSGRIMEFLWHIIFGQDAV